MRPIFHPIAKLRCNRCRPRRQPPRHRRRAEPRAAGGSRPRSRLSQRTTAGCRGRTDCRAGEADSAADRRHPRRMPVRFHVPLLGVQPGGAEALQCLKRNEAQLSAACRSAVAAIGGGGAGAAAAPSGAPAATAAPAVAPIGPMPMLRPRDALAIVQICGAEVRSLCAGVPFGGGRIISCLAANASSLSPSCYGALSAAVGNSILGHDLRLPVFTFRDHAQAAAAM